MSTIRRALLVLCLSLLLTTTAGAQTLTFGGTGGAIGTLRIVGAAFHRATGIDVVVLPSLGTQGGIRAITDGRIDIAVVGRGLTDAEQTRGLRSLLVLRTPYGFATSTPAPPSLAPEVFAAYLAEPRSKWPDGTPVRAILRPAAESDYLVIHAAFPGTDAAFAQLRRRGDVPVAATDQENLDLAERVPGSLVGTTLSQVVTEQRNLRFVPVNGIKPSIEALVAGMYPAAKSFHFLASTRESAAIAAFTAFVASDDGQTLMRQCGIVP